MQDVKVLNVQWIYNMDIVTIDNGYEVKTYIKQVRGLNEKEDIQDVIEYGYKIYPEQLERILSFYKTGENNER